MRERTGRNHAPRALLAAALLAAGCGEQAPAGSTDAAAAPRAGAAVRDPRLDEARRALEAGLPDAAWVLLEKLDGAGEAEVFLLRARAALAEGDGVGALREIDDAHGLHPDAPEVAGTKVEILAALDRLPAAEDELALAQKAFGRGAVLERARGVLLLRSSGRGSEALAALEHARALDPALAFVDFPLAQAHFLAGRAELGAHPEAALAHARSALANDPENPDYRELEADALAADLDFEGALAIYDQLASEGRPGGAARGLLHQKLATRLLLEHRRAEAVAEYAQARALGVDDAGLGFGATVLAEEAEAALERGIAAFEARDPGQAESEFRAALALDPASLEARNHLGVALFARADYAGAAAAWQELLDAAAARPVELPDPVHLNLARALRLAGEPARAREVLEAYLERAPEGAYAPETRELLEHLDREGAVQR